MDLTVEQLNERFGKPGIVFETGRGGLIRAVISAPTATGELYLHGAHVTHFQPSGEQPVLWMSGHSYFEAGKPIRGGVPICFPWFGPPPADKGEAPAHGLARLSAWNVHRTDVDEEGAVTLVLDRHVDPFVCQLVARFGTELELSLSFRLSDRVALEMASYQVALHSYFLVGDIASVKVTGLERFPYIDKLDGATIKPATGQAIQFDAECDRVYMGTTGPCLLHDPVLGRQIRIENEDSSDTVVWNPWIAKAARMPDFGHDEWKQMVCIETANVSQAPVLTVGKTARIATRIAVDR
jgi:glucose-6-phosphate 1-epimerase